MYFDTRSGDDAGGLTILACRTFLGLSVIIATLGLIAKGWLPGAILTAATYVIVWLLSQSLDRLVQAVNARAWRIAVQTLVMATGFVALETNLNHIGLAHLNDVYDLVPVDYLWPACWFISLVNVFATNTYTSELAEPKPCRPQAALRAGSFFALAGARGAGSGSQLAAWEARPGKNKPPAIDPSVTAVMAYVRSRLESERA